MKRFILSILTLFMGFSLFSQSLEEQTRQYLREKLVFYYVDNPAAAKPADISTLEINKNDIADNKDITSPVWTSANNAGLKSILIKILRAADKGGDVRMQRVMRNVLLLSGKKVYVFLYNDVPNAAPHSSWIYCKNSSSYPAANSNASWPCAQYFDDRTLEASGHIGIGAYFFSPTRTTGDWSTTQDKGHVFIHELVHTQVPLVLESSLGSVDMYGNDGSHNFQELLPSRNSAFNEGIATSFAFRYYVPGTLSMTKWYNDNMIMNIDNLTGCGALPPPAHCLQTRLTGASVAAEGACWNPKATCYKLRSIPASIVLYNENVSANILYQYMQQFGSELMLVRDVKNALTEMNKSSNYTFAPLFKEMVKSGMNYRNSKAGAGVVTHGQLLPIAILDYYTGYQIPDKATLGSAFGITWDNTYTNIDDYFSSKRKVLTGFRTNATTWHVGQQLDKFAEHINVKISPAASSTSTAPRVGNN